MNVAKTALSLLITQAAAGSALIIILLAVRGLTKKHVRAGLMYGAWLLVAIRLMLPMSLMNPLLPSAAKMQAPAVTAPSTPVQPLAHDTAPVISPLIQKADAMTVPAPAYSPGISLEPFLLLLWGAGALLAATVMVLANRRLMKSAHLMPVDLPGSKYPVCLSSLPSPCVLKVFRPVIALTIDSMRPENLRYALLHETCHLRRGDLLWSLLRNILCAVFWFCPLVWLAAAASRRDCELSLDENVKRCLHGDERFEYAQTLLRLAGRPLPFSAAAMSSRKRDLKERLECIMSSRLPKRSVSAFIAVLLCLTCLISFATAGQAPLPPESTPPPATIQANA
jgi:beta-lactamase regulating signal transducer with metallopeptidase domain